MPVTFLFLLGSSCDWESLIHRLLQNVDDSTTMIANVVKKALQVSISFIQLPASPIMQVASRRLRFRPDKPCPDNDVQANRQQWHIGIL